MIVGVWFLILGAKANLLDNAAFAWAIAQIKDQNAMD